MLSVNEILKSTTVRLVKNTQSPFVLSSLADGEEELRILVQNRVKGSGQSRPREGNRFDVGARRSWYCALDILTAIKEVAYHHIRDMCRNRKDFRSNVIYHELLAEFIGDFCDIQERKPGEDILGTEPGEAYKLGQKFACEQEAKGKDGIIYESVRKPEGICLAVFSPQTVQNVRLGSSWKLIWNGSSKYEVWEGKNRMEELEELI